MQPQPGIDPATVSMRGNHLAYAATQGIIDRNNIYLYKIRVCYRRVCYIRSGVTRCTFTMCSTCAVCVSVGYTRCSGSTPVYFCSASLYSCCILAPPRSSLLPQFAGPVFIPLSVSLWNNLADPVFDVVCGTGGFQEQSQFFFLLLNRFLSSTVFPFLFFLFIG